MRFPNRIGTSKRMSEPISIDISRLWREGVAPKRASQTYTRKGAGLVFVAAFASIDIALRWSAVMSEPISIDISRLWREEVAPKRAPKHIPERGSEADV